MIGFLKNYSHAYAYRPANASKGLFISAAKKRVRGHFFGNYMPITKLQKLLYMENNATHANMNQPQKNGKSRRGFASMDKERHKLVSSKGGKAIRTGYANKNDILAQNVTATSIG